MADQQKTEAHLKSEQVREAQEELSGLRSLLNHPGYKELIGIAKDQIEARTQAIFLTPLKSIDETLEQEYKKGEIQGIKLFIEMTRIRIQNLEEEIQAALSEGRQEQDFSSNNRLDEETGYEPLLDD